MLITYIVVCGDHNSDPILSGDLWGTGGTHSAEWERAYTDYVFRYLGFSDVRYPRFALSLMLILRGSKKL